MYDPQVDALGETTWIPGRQYPEPTFIGRVPTATYGTPFHISVWGMRTTALTSYQAPPITFKTNQVYPIKKPQGANIGTQQGAAPASGIYTGVPANGCHGGNPYS